MSGGAEQLSILGRTFADQGDHPKALDYFEQALERYRATHDKTGEALTLFDIAMSFQTMKDKDKAYIYFDKALQLFAELQDELHVADTCFHLAQYLYAYGNHERAMFYMQTAHDVYNRLGRNTIETQYFIDVWRGREDSSLNRRRAFMGQLLSIYEQEGEAKFRDNMRRSGMPDNGIDSLVTTLRQYK